MYDGRRASWDEPHLSKTAVVGRYNAERRPRREHPECLTGRENAENACRAEGSQVTLHEERSRGLSPRDFEKTIRATAREAKQVSRARPLVESDSSNTAARL